VLVLRYSNIVSMSLLLTTAAYAQTPQPFPRPGTTQQKPAPPVPAPPAAAPIPARPDGEPNEAVVGAPIYPSAVYLTSYDAGRGQRFYLFGVTVPYAGVVTYYRTVLKTNGDRLFESPPTHQFETARYRDESMAFPPSVTIKDYTYGGAAGYPNPKTGASPARFPTVIQIVPPPR